MIHYKKDISVFSQDEQKLYLIDTLLSCIFEDMSENPKNVDMFKIQTATSLVGERTKLVIKILGVNPKSPQEEIDVVENSIYSFVEFLRVKQENIIMNEIISKWN